jgi:phenylalanyl-tRNA synthetase beta chain
MRVSVRWLQELTGTELPVSELARLFPARGLGVEEIVRVGEALASAVVAEVAAVQSGTVTLFDGRDVLELEAPTAQLSTDAKVAYDPARKALVSESELGIEGSTELVRLVSGCEAGTPVCNYVDDEILVLELPPNRGDLTGMIGIGRELACYLEREFTLSPVNLVEGPEAVGSSVGLEVRDPQDTPDYIARLVRHVQVRPSPFWLKWRLIACGIRPISNIVDITNYILFKHGQPLHAFDFRKLNGAKIVTRRATAEESIVTIDGVERKLSGPVLVIADAERPVAVAGVMGGRATEIASDTKDVLIECARFAPAVIRHSSRALGLATEASQRFEVGVDPGALDLASREAAALMQSLAAGEVLAGTVAVRSEVPKKTFSFSWRQINRLLGLELQPAPMSGILNRLGFKVTTAGTLAHVEVPSFRFDIETTADLAEEVGRIVGYDGIPSRTTYTTTQAGRRHDRSLQSDRIGAILSGLGFDEIQTVSFTSEPRARRFTANPVLLPKPLNERYNALRPTLLATMLDAVGLNLRRGNSDLRLFEIGASYDQPACPTETLRCAGLLTGNREPLFWETRPQPVSFYDALGAVQELLETLGVGTIASEAQVVPGMAAGGSAAFLADRLQLGFVGAISSELANEFGITAPVFGFELNWDALWQQAPALRRYQPLPRFPAVERDFALVVDLTVNASQLLAEVRRVAGPVLERVAVFDHYVGPSLPADKRSIGIRLTLRALDHTLASAEVEETSSRMIAAVRDRLGAELRK